MAHNEYRQFMINIFKSLNPIHFKRGERILNELEDVNQVTFVMRGKYRVGYAVNFFECQKLELTKGSIIGGYECSYDRRSTYIFRAKTDLEGYFITKKQWKKMEID